jgi:hypothetical protein
MLLEDVSFGREAMGIVAGISLSKVTVCAHHGLFPSKRQGTGHPITYALADMLDLAAALLLYDEAGLSMSRACQAMAGVGAWEILARKPFGFDPATGQPEPLLTLSVGQQGQWFVGHVPGSSLRLTISLLPVYARVRAGLDRYLARHPDDRIAAMLPAWDAWFAEHVRARRCEAGLSPRRAGRMKR